MKVKIYVDWTNESIMSQKEGEAKLASRLNDKDDYEDYRNTCLDDIIKDWLDSKKEVHCSEYYKKVFDLSTEERAEPAFSRNSARTTARAPLINVYA